MELAAWSAMLKTAQKAPFRVVHFKNYQLHAVVPTARRQGAAVRSRVRGIAIASRYVISGRTYVSAVCLRSHHPLGNTLEFIL
jgi:hypothetical protein